MLDAIPRLLLTHLLSVIGFGMGLVLLGHLLRERKPTGSTLAWILAIFLIPYVGVPLYLVFGGRKLKRRAAQKGNLYGEPVPISESEPVTRMLCWSGVPAPSPGNAVEWLPTGESAYAALMETVNGAKHSLHLSTLILGDDEVGHAILARLVARAREGLEVYLLLDALFHPRVGRRLAALKKAGGHSALFMPVIHVPFRGHANLRLHRKIVVADGEVAIVGGMNLAREYMGPVPMAGRWLDLSARIRGPAVTEIDAVFRADWKFAAKGVIEPSPTRALPVAAGEGRIQVVGSGPDVQSDLIYDAFLSAIFTARTRLWLATPYFVPDEALARAVVLAVRRGVDVRIFLPERSNHRIADLAGRSYLRDIVGAGGRVFPHAPGMMHAKVVIVDDALACLGSANLDMRSFFLDYEIGLFFTSPDEVRGLADWFSKAVGVTQLPLQFRNPPQLSEAVARLVAPLV